MALQGLSGFLSLLCLGYTLYQEHLYYVIVAAFLLSWFFLRNLSRSPVGIALRAIRDSEEAAASLGINITLYKVTCFALGCIGAGLAGSLHIVVTGYLNPQTVGSLDLMLLYTAAVIVGGAGTLKGPFYGMLLLVLLPELLAMADEYRIMLFGLALVAIVLLAPGGIAPLVDRLWHRLSLSLRRHWKPYPEAKDGTKPA